MSKLAFVEHWLVSVPVDPDFETSQRYFNEKMVKVKTKAIYSFHMPFLTVSTLDSLVAAHDDMMHLESMSESVITKLASCLVEVTAKERKGGKLLEMSILADGLNLQDYLIYFNWDVAKYPIHQSVTNLSPLIRKQIVQIEQDLSTRMKAYSTVQSSLTMSLKKRAGTFATKYLGDLVTRDDFILESEVLRTVVTAVPIAMKDLWWQKYEHLNDTIVPKSSRLINEDDEYSLFTVTLLKDAVRDFAQAAKLNGFLPRVDFDYDEDEICEFNRSWQLLHRERTKMFEPLLRWLRMSFSEAYIAYVHIKATKVFVESIIRFGLPENFNEALVQMVIVDKRRAKNMKEQLKKLYKQYDPAIELKTKKDTTGTAEKEEYFPVVLSRIRVSLNEVLNL